MSGGRNKGRLRPTGSEDQTDSSNPKGRFLPLAIPCPMRHDNNVKPAVCRDCPDLVSAEKGGIVCRYGDNGARGRVDRRNRLNELTGNEWLYFTKSVIRTSYPSTFCHHLRREHGANKPPQLMRHIIEFFTKQGGSVLDPFAGVGGTLIGASLCGRRAVGVEINPRWIEIYQNVCGGEGIEPQEIVNGDCVEVLKSFQKEGRAFDLVLTDPPYSMALERTMCTGRYPVSHRTTHFTNDFSDSDKDLRNAASFEDYYRGMGLAVDAVRGVLKEGGYLVMIIRDSYQDGQYIMASYDVARIVRERGFVMKGIKVWYQTGARVRPYGYPYSYVPNTVHQNIIIFQKGAK